MSKFFTATGMILTLIVGLMMSTSVMAASSCKGKSKNSCSTSCTWVDSYKTKTGSKVNGYCRAKPGKSSSSSASKSSKSKSATSKPSKSKKSDSAKKSVKKKTDKAKSKAKKDKKVKKAKADKKVKKAKKPEKKSDKSKK